MANGDYEVTHNRILNSVTKKYHSYKSKDC